ncbi:MAG: CHASE3 domain-containing protein [Rhodocyclaceae bacterium]|nr:CHASE3 domain-containing protein [Rhodocyclaceae bacterium]
MSAGVFRWRTYAPVLMLLIGMAVSIVAAVSADRNLTRLAAMTALRAEVRQTRLELTQLLSMLKDVETAQRGYILTGNEAYLQPYRDSADAIPSALARVSDGFPASALPQSILPGLAQAIDERLRIAAANITVRRDGGRPAVDALDAGKAAMDHLRLLAEEIDGRSVTRIDEINRSVHVLQREARASAVASTTIGAAFIALGALLLVSEIRARRRLAARLVDVNRDLESRVASRTAELAKAHEELKGFARRCEEGVERERRHLAREVHDRLGQAFTSIRMAISLAGPGTLPAELQRQIEMAIDDGVDSARRIAAELRPPLLDDLGLAAALSHFGRQLAAKSGVAVEVAVEVGLPRTDRRAVQVFRIVQEACANALAHGAPQSIWIRDEVSGEDLLVTIHDDGRGFDPGRVRAGALGLVGMRERAAIIGARMQVASAPGEGTTVRIQLPIEPGPPE